MPMYRLQAVTTAEVEAVSDGPTLTDLWDLSYVAYSHERADQQAERQIGPYIGRTLEWNGEGCIQVWFWCHDCRDTDCEHIPVDDGGDAYCLLAQPLKITVNGFNGDEWARDNTVTYPVWDIDVHAETVILDDGTVVSAAVCDFEYEAPGIGTAEGFADKDNLIWPLETSAAGLEEAL